MTNKMNVLLLPLAVCFPCFSKYNVFPLTVAFPILTVQVILGRLILLGTATLSNISTCCHQTSGYVSFFRWFSSYVSSKGSVSFATTVIFDSCKLQYLGVILSIHIQESKKLLPNVSPHV